MQETRNNFLGRKYVARPFVKRKQVSTSAVIIQSVTQSLKEIFGIILSFNVLKSLIQIMI